MQKVTFSSRNGTLNIKYKIVQKDPNMKGLTYCQLASATGAGKKMTNITSGTAVRDESWNCFHPRRSIPDKRKRVTSSVYAVSVRETTRNPSVHHESCIFVWKWCPDRNYFFFFLLSSVRHFYLFLANCQHFCPCFLSPSQIHPFVYLSISLSFQLSLSSLVALLLYAIICWPNSGSKLLRMEGICCKHRGNKGREEEKKAWSFT